MNRYVKLHIPEKITVYVLQSFLELAVCDKYLYYVLFLIIINIKIIFSGLYVNNIIASSINRKY